MERILGAVVSKNGHSTQRFAPEKLSGTQVNNGPSCQLRESRQAPLDAKWMGCSVQPIDGHTVLVRRDLERSSCVLKLFKIRTASLRNNCILPAICTGLTQ